VKIEEIVDGLVLYMHSDALTKGLPGGKTWLKLDLRSTTSASGCRSTCRPRRPMRPSATAPSRAAVERRRAALAPAGSTVRGP
jgi:hypothetical protein